MFQLWSYLDSEPDLAAVVLVLTADLPVLTLALVLRLPGQRGALRATGGAVTSICKCGLTGVTRLICYTRLFLALSFYLNLQGR